MVSKYMKNNNYFILESTIGLTRSVCKKIIEKTNLKENTENNINNKGFT